MKKHISFSYLLHKDKLMMVVSLILADLGVEVTTMKEEGIFVDVEENGTTYEENAMIKAREVAKYTDAIV